MLIKMHQASRAQLGQIMDINLKMHFLLFVMIQEVDVSILHLIVHIRHFIQELVDLERQHLLM